MENTTTRILDSALDLIGRRGLGTLTVRAVEEDAGLPHGSVRHHFGSRDGLIRALFHHLGERDLPVTISDRDSPTTAVAAALRHWLGPGRTVTLARYELFLMAARDPALRPPLVRARERFVALTARRVGAEAAPAVVAALDGLVLDALVRGEHNPAALGAAVARITSPSSSS
ncbi:MAG: TetR family transcriptional regulator [Solirubrobacterales bacterium]